MSNPSIRLHGDAPLIDPELLKGYCSTCKHKRDWKLVKTNKTQGTFVKACKTCGMRVVAKIPKKKRVAQAKPKKADEGNILQKLGHEINKITSKLTSK
jgi:hypothetical protein